MLAQDLIRRAFRLINSAGGTGNVPDNNEADDALAWLNSMIDAWAVDGLTMYRLLRTTQNLTASTASYTIGTGGTINIARPVEIYNAGLVLDRTVAATQRVEAPIRVLTNDEYARWPLKSFETTYPRGIWYDHDWSAGLGLIYVLPIPDQGNSQLAIYTPVAIAEFADLATTDYTFPPGYEECLEYNLALRLATPFGRDIPDFVQRLANASLALVKRHNIRLAEVSIDPTFPPPTARRTVTQSQFDGGLL